MPKYDPPPAPTKQPLIIAAAKLAPHVLAGVKAMRRWDDYFDVTEEELSAAIREFDTFKIG